LEKGKVMKKFLLTILILLLIGATAHTQVKQQWVRTANTSNSGFKDIHLDAAGNVYVLGCSSDSSNSSWIQLASFSPSGEQRFCIYNNSGMVVSGWFFDAEGNIYIGGYYTSYSGSVSSQVFKYNASGVLQWTASDSEYNKGMLRGFTGDASGNSYLLKYYWGRNTIIKFNSNGSYVQSINIDELFNSGTIVSDAAGNIVVAGLQSSDQYGKCIVIRYNSRGKRLWSSVYEPKPGILNTNKFLIKFYNSNVYIMTSASYPGSGSDYLLVKYGPDGTILAVSQYDKANDDVPSDFVVDGKSNAIVTGNNGTVKFNKKGTISWIDTTRNIVSAAADKLNNVYLTGKYCYTVGTTYTDMISLRISQEGIKMWSLFYKEADPISYEAGQVISVDTSLNVYACGYKINSSITSGAILKYTQQYIDTTNLRFMPLAIGNVWIYKVTHNNISGYIKTTITRDTIAEGKRYFYFSNFPLTGYSNWLRTDSITGNLYAYAPLYNCFYSAHERIIDSLSSGKSDTLRDCTSETEYKTCVDTGFASLGVKITSFKQFQNISQNALTRCYAKDFGIYSIHSGDAAPTIYTLKGCFINGHIYGDTMMRFSISGTVRYKDNRQPVTHGKVKALKYMYTTGKITAIDSSVISGSGAFRLENISLDSCDIMAYQDDEMDDFPPGFHDSTIYWQSSVTLVTGVNISNIDVYVERIIKETGSNHIDGHVYALNSGSNSPPLENTRIYVLSESIFKSFDITDSSGSYSIDSILPGEYTFIVDRLGFYPTQRQVILSGYSKDTVDFYLLKYAGVDKDFSSIPTKYSLIQNYPNPFNPSTTFVFDIPSTSNVSLTIFDITGREICRIMNRKMNSGRYKIIWDASELASGIYFYRLEARNDGLETGYIETKKLVLMK
jgi:hypothetical protein